MQPSEMKILFICSRNQWWSGAAETIFKGNQQHNIRSAGTATNARVKVNSKLIDWARVIFAMENRHKQLLKERFIESIQRKKIIVLDIEDRYSTWAKNLLKYCELL